MLTMRQLAPVPRPPLGYEEEAWVRILAALRALFSKAQLPGGSREELYRLIEALCLGGWQVELARRLHAECESHVSSRLAVVAAAAAESPQGRPVVAWAETAKAEEEEEADSADLSLLGAMDTAWRDHCEAMQEVCALFLFLDRTHLLAQGAGGPCSGGGSLWACGLRIFRDRLAELPGLRQRVLMGVLRLIDVERYGRSLPRSLLASLASMFSRLGIYVEMLEPPLLERTARFYSREAEALLAGSCVAKAVAEYLVHCETRFNEEERRCSELLETRTTSSLLSLMREELLTRQCERILEGGFASFVFEHRVQDLARLYRLLAQVNALGAVRKSWVQAIKRLGAEVMASSQDPEASKALVPALIDLKEALDELLSKAFDASSDFSLALKDAFHEFLNAGSQNLPAKLLARYVDEVLRNEKACGDAACEAGLDRAMAIFRFLAAKDAFEAFYRKDLAKRLLLQRSASEDGELLMLQKLREECGGSYTSKMEGMFRDMDLSKGLLATFRTSRPEAREVLEGGDAPEFTVVVLTSGLWPTQPVIPEVSYPPMIAKIQEMFAVFYAAQHAGRSLHWSPLLGQATLKANYGEGLRKELVVSHLQALVLLLFNKADSLTCEEIAAATGITAADLHRTLQSLALHKSIKLLLKESKGRTVSDSDVFSFNTAFAQTCRMHHLSVPQITQKDSQEEEAAVEQRVFEDRQHTVDAVLVRIMKAKKSLTHQELLAEVFAVVSFPIKAADVKTRIEALIEREYLERDPERPSAYHYLA